MYNKQLKLIVQNVNGESLDISENIFAEASVGVLAGEVIVAA